MTEPLSFSNFFEDSFYIIHPFKKTLQENDHTKALIYSIFLGIFTLGLVHLGCWFAERRVRSVISREDKGIAAIDETGRNSMYKGENQLPAVSSSTGPEISRDDIEERSTKVTSPQDLQREDTKEEKVIPQDLQKEDTKEEKVIPQDLQKEDTKEEKVIPQDLQKEDTKVESQSLQKEDTEEKSQASSTSFGIPLTQESAPISTPTAKKENTEVPPPRIPQRPRPILVPSKTEEVAGKKIQKEKTNKKGAFCIETISAGYIGAVAKRQLLPYYYLEEDTPFPKLTLENGDPIRLDSEDFMVPCVVFNPSKALRKLLLPARFWLPSALLKDLEGDSVLRLRYGGKLIELYFQEDHQVKFQKGSLKEVLELCELDAKEKKFLGPLWSIIPPHPFYRLGEEGALYGLKQDTTQENTFNLEKKDPAKLRPVKDPELVKAGWDEGIRDGKTVGLALNTLLPGFIAQEIDIVLNAEYLIIYAQSIRNPIPSAVLNTLLGSGRAIDLSLRRQFEGGVHENIVYFKWKNCEPLQNFTLEVMQAKLSQGSISLFDGFFHLEFSIEGKT